MNTSNIFGFEETEKMGLRKGVVYYFNDWIDEKISSILEEIVEQFLSLTQAQFTKKRSGENDAYVNRRNIRGGWKKVFHRAFDNFDDSDILILDNCTPQQLQTIYTCMKPTNYRLVLLNTRFSCYKKMKDLERAMQVRQEADALISSSTKASVQKTGQKMLKAMDASLALWRGEYETFRRMEEARSAGYTAKLQKVVSAVCLADVDIACNELKNARTHLEYAIREGGTLYVVEDARRMLAELAQKERVEGAGHGDGTVEN